MHLLTFRGVNGIFLMKTKKTILVKSGINNAKKWAKGVDQIYEQQPESSTRKYNLF